ncbi:MAG TPA: tetratricopeptide repeat protein [Oligoflexia bacterium]|nr:tetratricopeptide repeat protein [Oligoflexia bacterium]HMR23918.1 tetratricopeptide repeat protein [Oligoflexia bacterium]
MPKQYPCEKNELCGALNKLDINFLPRERFELECSLCNETVVINPKILNKPASNRQKAKENPDTNVSIAVNIHEESEKKKKQYSSKAIPIISVITGILIVIILSFLLVKVVFKTSLTKYKSLAKKQVGQEQIYYNKQKIILDITTDDYTDLKSKASDELQKTTVRSQFNDEDQIQSRHYNHSKQYSDYIKRYSKLPKNIREVYESFKIDQIKLIRELIIQHINNVPEHNYIGNIILSELYSYLSYIEEKPDLNNFAMDNLNKLSNSYPKTAEWKRSMAFAFYCSKDYNKSYEYILSIKDIFQNDPIVQTIYSSLIYRLKDKNQGKKLLHRTYLISPKHYLVNHFYSDLLFEEKDYAKAAKLYKKISFSKENHPELIKKAIYTLNHEKDWLALAALYQKYYSSTDDIDIKLNFAKALSRSDKASEALKYLETIKIEGFDNDQKYQYLFELAYANYVNKNFLQANRTFIEADKVLPNKLINLKYIGNSYFRLGRYYNAIDYYKRAYKIEPSSALQKNIALSYYESKQYENAINEFSSLLETDQNNYIFTFYLAKAFLKIEQEDKALIYANKALTLSKDNTQIKTFIDDLQKQIEQKTKSTKVKEKSKTTSTLKK